MNSLTDKVILVTGAASGIGRATLQRCAAAGAKLIAADRADEDAIKAAIPEDAHSISSSLDVTDEAAVQSLVSTAVTEFGEITGLVNCAGVSGQGLAHEINRADWQKVLDINLTGTLLVCKHVIASMLNKKTQGSIVNLASVYGMTGGPGSLSYNVSKSGVLHMTRCMAADYGGVGIRINSVSPGYIETPMSSMVKADPAFHKRFVNMHLLRRAGQPEEVAGAINFLLSDDASYITGANFAVDGGFSAAHQPF